MDINHGWVKRNATWALGTVLLYFFQNKVISIQLGELDELDRITHVWMGFNYSLTHSSVMVRVADSYASDLGWIPGLVYEFFVNFILLNSSN